MKQIDEDIILNVIKTKMFEMLKEQHKEKCYFAKDENKLVEKYSKLTVNQLKEFIE